MIIRRLASSTQLISQPQHAQLAARIMLHWRVDGFPETARRESILSAIEHHDDGWTDADESLVLDETTGRLLDFMEVPDAIKRATASRGIERLASDAYAAALVAQHRLHVYRRHISHPEWRTFFTDIAAIRESHLSAAGVSLGDLLHDYRFVRAADLASLAFCNSWAEIDGDGSGYVMRLDGVSLVVSPDPFDGQTIPITIEARQLRSDAFGSAAEAQRAVATSQVVILRGSVKGA